MPKSDDDIVAVWRNTSKRPIHRDCRKGSQSGLVMPAGGTVAMVISERDSKGAPPSNVKEEIMTRKEAREKYGKTPLHEK